MLCKVSFNSYEFFFFGHFCVEFVSESLADCVPSCELYKLRVLGNFFKFHLNRCRKLEDRTKRTDTDRQVVFMTTSEDICVFLRFPVKTVTIVKAGFCQELEDVRVFQITGITLPSFEIDLVDL